MTKIWITRIPYFIIALRHEKGKWIRYSKYSSINFTLSSDYKNLFYNVLIPDGNRWRIILFKQKPRLPSSILVLFEFYPMKINSPGVTPDYRPDRQRLSAEVFKLWVAAPKGFSSVDQRIRGIENKIKSI